VHVNAQNAAAFGRHRFTITATEEFKMQLIQQKDFSLFLNAKFDALTQQKIISYSRNEFTHTCSF